MYFLRALVPLLFSLPVVLLHGTIMEFFLFLFLLIHICMWVLFSGPAIY